MSKKEKIYIGTLILVLIGSLVFMIFQFFNASHAVSEVEAVPIIVEEPTVISPDIQEDIQHVTQLNPLTDEELIARVVMAEAEGEEMIGKVAVAMTVLNRCDYYGLTVETVVYAELNGVKQYSVSDTYNDECMKAVEIAQANRELFPSTMMWFKLDGYHDFKNGNPQDYMPIGKHYFSWLNKEEMK